MRTNIIENDLIKLGISVFSVREFANMIKVDPYSAKLFLIRNSKKNGSHIIRIKRGLYLFSLNPISELEIANKLYQPSYVSFETALSHYNIIPEIVYTITSATTKRGKEITAQDKIFRYYKIKKSLYFGYRPTKFNNRVVLMADSEKALLDYVYLLSLKKGVFNRRLDLSGVDTKKLGNYVNHFKKAIKKNKAFISLINEIYKPL